MFLFDWFWSILNLFGFGNKTGKVLFLGLDAAGNDT